MAVRTSCLMCILVDLATSWTDLSHLALGILLCSISFLCNVHTRVCVCIYSIKKATKDTFAVAVLTVFLHKFTLCIVFLDQLLLSELSELVLGAASIWNIEV